MTLTNNHFEDSHALTGGALYFNAFGTNEITITNCVFKDTKSALALGLPSYGGAIFFMGANADHMVVKVTDSTFENNYAILAGGVFYF